MRRIYIAGAVLAATMAISTFGLVGTASAACLNPDAGTVDLTNTALANNSPAGYDVQAYNHEMAKGNRCDVTEQSIAPDQISDYNPLTTHKPQLDFTGSNTQ